MKRIDTATKAEDLFGAGKHGFKDGNVLTGEQPTVLNADWFNHVQEELAAVVEVVIGTALDPNARNQIATGLAAIIATLAPKASPAFTGNPTAPTQSAGNNSTRIATTEFVQAALAALVDAAPGALDTLSELAAALGDDPNFATTITNLIATKLSLAGGTLTGFLTLHAAPTGPLHAATKEYVDEAARFVATQPDAEAGLDNEKIMTSLRTRQAINSHLNVEGSAPIFPCRAFVRCSGDAAPVIERSGNVSSVARTSNGVYVINFLTAPPAGFAAMAHARRSGGSNISTHEEDRTASSITISCNSTTTNGVNAETLNLMVIG